MAGRLPKIPPKANHGGRVFETGEGAKAPWAHVLDFSVNLNPMGPPKVLFAFLFYNAPAICHYPEPWCRSMKEAIASHLEIDPSKILPGSGSTPLIYLIPRLLRPKRSVIIGPAFAEYGQALAALGLQYKYVHADPAEGFLVTPEVARKALSLKPDLIFVANPANPSGRLLPGDSLVPLLIAAAVDDGPHLAIDEAFIDFCHPDISAARLAAKTPKIIVLRSMTKVFCVPGLRLGYAVWGDSRGIEAAESLTGPWAVSTLAQMAARFLLGKKDYLARAPLVAQRARAILQQGLASFKQYPSYANYVLFDLSEHGPEYLSDLTRNLLINDIHIRLASDMPGVPPGHVRLAALGLDATNELIEVVNLFHEHGGYRDCCPPLPRADAAEAAAKKPSKRAAKAATKAAEKTPASGKAGKKAAGDSPSSPTGKAGKKAAGDSPHRGNAG